jgi:hypothetical protein
VAAGILPAVEGGTLPLEQVPDFSNASELSAFYSRGWKPGSTAGRMFADYHIGSS